MGLESATDEESLDTLKAMLTSWHADVPQQDIRLLPVCKMFTRQAYADLLRRMGPLLEEWHQSSPAPPGADGEAGEPHTECRVDVRLYDWEVWKDWWRTRTAECFPTVAKFHGLHMTYWHRECLSDIVSESDADISLRPLETTSV